MHAFHIYFGKKNNIVFFLGGGNKSIEFFLESEVLVLLLSFFCAFSFGSFPRWHLLTNRCPTRPRAQLSSQEFRAACRIYGYEGQVKQLFNTLDAARRIALGGKRWVQWLPGIRKKKVLVKGKIVPKPVVPVGFSF